MGDIRDKNPIRFRDGTVLGSDQADHRLLFWACLGRVLSSPSQWIAPLASWEAVADECQREFDFIAGQLIASGSSDMDYQEAAADLAFWRQQVLERREGPAGLPATGPMVPSRG